MIVADNKKNHYIIKSKSIFSVQSKKDQSLTHKKSICANPALEF